MLNWNNRGIRSDVRPAVVAGQFYPGDPDHLREAVTEYLDDSGVEPAATRVFGLIAPHAGYIYSGPTAGHAYARVRGKPCARIILLGRSHRYGFAGWHVYPSGGFETPLGIMPIDEAFARELTEGEGDDARLSHASEHALEVQLPFLQVAVGEAPIVPILFGSDPGTDHEALFARLASMTGENDLVVASTDLSHYLSEEEANKLDQVSLDVVMEKDPARLAEGLRTGSCAMCGGTAVFTAMGYACAKGAEDWHLLDYRTSATASRDRSRVVGYGAVSMERAA